MKTLVVALNLALAVTAYAETAVEAWAQRYSNLIDSSDQPTKVVTDTAGNAIVAGNTSDGVTGGDILVIKYANGGPPLWTNRYNGPGSSFDVAADLATDGSGNVIVAGSSEFDFVTIKYSSAGAPLWTNRLSGEANAMVVDGSGNVIVTGSSYNTEPNGDYATIKYSSLGVPLWTNRYNGPGDQQDSARAVAVDASGNVFVTGKSYSGSSDDYATVAYSSLGVPLWTNRYNGPGNGDDVAQAVAVSGTNVFVTGYAYGGGSGNDYATIGYSTAGATLWVRDYNGSGNDYDEAAAVLVAGTNVFVTGFSYDALNSYDCVTLVYSRAGTPLSTNRYNGPANSDDRGAAIVADASNRVIVTGTSQGTSTGSDYATIVFSSAGVPLWTNRYDGGGGAGYSDEARAVAADSSGNIFVTGTSLSIASSDWATLKYSSGGSELWINHYNGLAQSDGFPQAVAVDGSGNILVTGYSYGNGSYQDYATIKYSSTGVPMWTNRFGGLESDEAIEVATDGSGNVFVTGFSTPIGGFADYYTIAYSSGGATLWSRRYNGTGSSVDRANAMALDSTGNVIVTGYSFDSISAGDYVTIAYANNGFPLWTNQYSGPGSFDDYAQAMAVDSSNNVIVTGYATGTGSGYDYATIKCSSAGVTLWTNRYNSPANENDQAFAVAVDSSGNVIVTGSSYGGATDYDFLTIKYSSTGVALWTNRYNGPANSYDQAWSVAVDKNDNVIVIGGASSGVTGYDFLTIKYSSAGIVQWTHRYSGPGNDYDEAYAVAVDGDDTVFVTGYSSSSASAGSGDFATIAYSNAGVPLWTNRYNGPGNGEDAPWTSRSLAVAGPGSVVVVGQSRLGQHNEYATVKYVTVPRLDIRRTATNTLAISWPSPSSGFQLQQNTNLAGTNWTATSAPSDNGTNKTFLVNPPSGSRFYRLFYQ